MYFQNKQNLFLYTYNFVLDTIVNELLNEINVDEKDLLERLNKFFLAELELLNRYPDMFEFVKMMNSEDISVLSEQISERNMEKVNQCYAKIFENIDQTKFQDDIEIEYALNIIRWTLDGLSNRYRIRCKQISLAELDFCTAKEEVDSYFKMFKRLFYKQERKDYNECN